MTLSSMLFTLLNHFIFFVLAFLLYKKKIYPLLRKAKIDDEKANTLYREDFEEKKNTLVSLQNNITHKNILLNQFSDHIMQWKIALEKEKHASLHLLEKRKKINFQQMLEQHEQSIFKKNKTDLQKAFVNYIKKEAYQRKSNSTPHLIYTVISKENRNE